MKHEGKAASAALRLIFISLAAVLALLGVAWLAHFLSAFVLALSSFLLGLWVLFTLFTFYFFRDPDAAVPAGPGLVLAPGHGKVDFVGAGSEPRFMGGECQRISIFLSVFDVHVQNAPLTGRVAFCDHTSGQFLNAMRVDCADFNENVLIGLDCLDPKGEKIAVRLIAGLIARRIIPWVGPGEVVNRGERISLIQFGSRVDVYLPARAKIKVKPGDRAVGGETVLASFS